MPVTYRRPLIDKDKNTIHPITCTKAVYNDEGKDLDELLKNASYRVVVTSTSGIISTKVLSATMTAKVMNGPADVTSSFINNYYIFKWTRTSTDSAADTVWNNNPDHYGVGKTTLTITSEDILYSATYTCSLCNND